MKFSIDVQREIEMVNTTITWVDGRLMVVFKWLFYRR